MATDFNVCRIEECDSENVMKLLRITFFVDEPLMKKIGYCTLGKKCVELEDLCRSALPGLSFKAVDSNGNIVGVLINGITPKQEINFKAMIDNCSNPKFKKILQFLEYRENNARIWERYPNDNKYFEVKVAATDPQWRNKGIMNVLVAHAEELAKKEGVRLMRLDASNEYSARAAQKLGFKTIYIRPFNAIFVDGQHLIVPDPPHILDRVFVKEL